MLATRWFVTTAAGGERGNGEGVGESYLRCSSVLSSAPNTVPGIVVMLKSNEITQGVVPT